MKRDQRRKLSIVFVCSEFPINGRPTGGFGAYVDKISKALATLDQQVTVICIGSSHKEIVQGSRKIIVLTPPLFRILNRGSHSAFSLVRRIFSFLNYPLGFSIAVARYFHREGTEMNINVIEGGDFGAELFFYLLFRKTDRPKVIMKLHTPSIVIRQVNQESMNLFYQTMDKLEAFCMRRADAIYSPTKSLADIIRDRYQLKVDSIIPYPIGDKLQKWSAKRSKLVLYVGKLQIKKGVFVLVKAIIEIIKRHPTTYFTFIGPDTKVNSVSVKYLLQQKLKKYRSRVTFLHPLPQKKLALYYKKAAVVVVPSLWENFPNVILEVATFGSAIVASKVGGIPEMVRDLKEAILVPPDDVEALTKAISRLLSDDQLRLALANSAKNRVISLYNQELIAQKTLNFYEEILKES